MKLALLSRPRWEIETSVSKEGDWLASKTTCISLLKDAIDLACKNDDRALRGHHSLVHNEARHQCRPVPAGVASGSLLSIAKGPLAVLSAASFRSGAAAIVGSPNELTDQTSALKSPTA